MSMGKKTQKPIPAFDRRMFIRNIVQWGEIVIGYDGVRLFSPVFRRTAHKVADD